MNSLLYNLSVVILLFGLMLMVHYTTKIYYQKKTVIDRRGPSNVYDSYIYQERPNTLFKKMFNSLGPWIGRTANPTDVEVDPEDVRVTMVTEPLLLFQ